MIDLFYKSYQPDFEWLYYSLESVKKFVTGYNQVIIIIPESEIALFDYQSTIGLRCTVIPVKEYGNGYLFQQVIKLKAYEYSEADQILFADSDCIFTIPVNVNDLMTDGKPEIIYTDYNKVGDAICWKKPTEDFLGFEQHFEFMRRFPLMYHRDTLITIAFYFPDSEQHIMESETFSEFNMIGAWIFKNEPDNYTFINTDYDALPPSLLLQQHFSSNKQDRIKAIKKVLNIKTLTTMKIDITQIRSIVMSCTRPEHTERRKKTLLSLMDDLGFSQVESYLGPLGTPYAMGARESILNAFPKMQVPFIMFEDDATVIKENYYPVLEVPEDTDILFLGGIPIGNKDFVSINSEAVVNKWNGQIGKWAGQITYIPVNDDFVRILNMYSAHAILFLTEKGKNQYLRYVNSYPLKPHDVAFSYGMAAINVLMVKRPFFYQDDINNINRTQQVIYDKETELTPAKAESKQQASPKRAGRPKKQDSASN